MAVDELWSAAADVCWGGILLAWGVPSGACGLMLLGGGVACPAA